MRTVVGDRRHALADRTHDVLDLAPEAWWIRLSLAVLLSACVAIPQIAIGGILNAHPFVIWLAVSVLAAWFLRIGPGLLLTTIGACVCYATIGHESGVPVDLLVYAVTAVFVNILCEALRREIETRDGLIEREASGRRALQVAEAALKQRAEEFRALVDNSPDIVSRLDLNLRYLYVNEAARRELGMAPDQIVGRSVYEYDLPAEQLQSWESALERLLETRQEVSREFSFTTPRGVRRYESRLVPEFGPDGSVASILATARNVTARHELEQALRDSQWRLRTVLSHVPLALWSFDASGTLHVAFGFHRLDWADPDDDLTGANVLDLPRVDADSRAAMQRALAGESVQMLAEFGTGTFEIHYVPSSLGSGEVIAVAFDVTARVRAERLAAEQVDLELRVRRAQAVADARGEFVATMSHEIRTPLQSITGFTELLLDDVMGPLSAEQRECVLDIKASSDHLVRTVSDVLDLTRTEAGRLGLEPMHTDVNAVAAEACAVVAPLARARGVHLRQEDDPDLGLVWIDPARLKQVMLNYLSNAVKFTDEGGEVLITVGPEGPDHFRLAVRDTGVGIRADRLGALFQAYSQPTGGTRPYDGTGLGLALTKSMVEAQGGSVGVSSTEGEGSTFYAVLPRMVPASPVIPGTVPVRERIPS